MDQLAIIGGTGFDRLETLEDRREQQLDTPYGRTSAPVVHGRLHGKRVLFLGRHGHTHAIAPHEINYRANLWALSEAGANAIVAVAAVGAIVEPPCPGGLALPNQLIDYTHGRASTFFEGKGVPVRHFDFTFPYAQALRERLLAAAEIAAIDVLDGGCYAAVQGPRLETAAEIEKLERDGCTLVGMTGMPEAILARELGIDYACCAVVANQAAGKGTGEITLEQIGMHLAGGMESVHEVLKALVRG